MKRNIFILGPDELNWEKLNSLRDADRYDFHELLSYEESHGSSEYNVPQMMEKAENQLDEFSGSIDAIVSFWDFPVSLMVAILGKKYGTDCAPLESVFKCEHKYWSRVEQQKARPDVTPAFARFDPFDDDALGKIDLEYPFWIKPIKSFGAHLGFLIESAEDFHRSIEQIRKKVGHFSEPFNYLLQFAEVPKEIREGGFFLAEQIIDGQQCTLEGFACDGEIDSHGVIDSYRHPNKVSFSHFEYPSRMPQEIRDRIKEASRDVMRQIGFDNSPFNIEFLYNRDEDKLWLLEINPRIAQSHSDLFKKVDGTSNHHIMVQVGLGNHPQWPRRQGDFGAAGKFFVRSFEGGTVARTPDAEDIARVKDLFPGTIVQSLVEEGQELSELKYQDSYSYKLALLYMGAENHEKLRENFEKAKEILGYKVTS
ncbi:MAG: ATP-grasp domain-containing protein [Desulfuromonadales bacterium]